MRELVILLALAFALVACTPSTSVPNDYPQLLKQTEGFEDCKIAMLTNSAGTPLYVVRCPNSITSTATNGKHPTRTVVQE